jgi:hypothetical protein
MMREAALYKLDSAFERDLLRRDQKMDVIRHNDEVVQQITALATIMLQRFEKELRGFFRSEDRATLMCARRNEEGSRSGASQRYRHAKDCTKHPQRLKPLFQQTWDGTAEAVPLSKAKGGSSLTRLLDEATL